MQKPKSRIQKSKKAIKLKKKKKKDIRFKLPI